ncbi:MAG: hypothetical protein JO332_10135 [Planctomycetaceae bacterium]|nr:hypothetical protein [Planctomycetaceae bacterium]
MALFPAAAQQESAVTYQDHVLPILTTHCLGCHNADKKKGDLDLSSYSATMAGGGSGEAAVAGDSGASVLYKVVAHLAEPKMPPKKPRISDAEIAVLKKWIDGGLIDAPGGKARKSKAAKVDLALVVPASGKPKGPAALPEDLLLEPAIHTPRPEAVTALAASPWAPVAAVAGQHQVLLYNTDTLDLVGVLPYPERRPTVLRFSRSGGLLLAGGGRGAQLGRVVAWDVKSGDRVFEIGEEFDQVLAADLSPDQSHVALGGPGKLVKIYSTKDGELQHSIKKHTDWVTAMEFSPDGVLLATGDRSGGLHVWEARTGHIFYSLNGHKGAITDISWRSDSNVVASSSEDGQVLVWEMGGGTKVKGWTAHPAAASVKYAQDGRLVTTGRDMLTRVWDGNGTKVRDFEAFSDLALRAVFTHDGTRVIAGDWTGEIRVWSVADGKRIGQLSTNPVSLADRLATEQKTLDAAKATAAAKATEAQAAQAASDKAAKSTKSADELVRVAQEVVQNAEQKLGDAEKALQAATQGVQSAQASVTARQAEAAQKAQAAKDGAAGLQKAKDELRKAQEAAAELQKQAAGDAAKAKDLEAAQKAAADKAAELARLSDILVKTQADADLAANAMGPAQKALADAQTAQKAAADAKAVQQAAQAQARQDLGKAQAAAADSRKASDAAAATAAAQRKASDEAARQAALIDYRVASLKAAQFNVQVYAAKVELAKIQAEYEALGAKGEDARRAAADADAKAKSADQTVVAAQGKIQKAEAALAEAKAGPARAQAALEAAKKVAAAKAERAASALPLVQQLTEAAGNAKDNATLAQAAAKVKETAELLKKDADDAAALIPARAAEIEKASAQIPAKDAELAQAKADAQAAAKKAAELHAAAADAAKRIPAEIAPAEAFKPRLDAARAKVEALRAQYLQLKPKSP